MRRNPFIPSMVQAITVLTVLKMMTKAQTSCGSGSMNGKVMYERLPNTQLQAFDDDIVRDTAPPFMVLEKCQDLCIRDRSSNNIVRTCTSIDFQPGSRIANFNGGPEYEESTCYLTREQGRPEGIGNLVLVPNSVHFTEICITSNRPERECPNRRYIFERHPRKKLKLPAADVKEMAATNRSECEDKCLNEFSFVCRSATFDADMHMCTLSRFTRRTHPEMLEDDPNSDYLENTCLNAERRCDGLAVFIKEENKRLGGPFEVDFFTNITLEDCQAMCVRAEKYFCRSIEYDEMTKQCTVSEEDSVSQKDDIGVSSSPTHHFYDFACLDSQNGSFAARGSEYPDNSVTSHLFTGKRPDTAFQRYRNSRLGGEHQSELSGRSLSECLDECLRQPSFQCRSAVYSDRYRTCRLSKYNKKDGMRIIYDADYDYYENLMLGGESDAGSTQRPGERPYRPGAGTGRPSGRPGFDDGHRPGGGRPWDDRYYPGGGDNRNQGDDNRFPPSRDRFRPDDRYPSSGDDRSSYPSRPDYNHRPGDDGGDRYRPGGDRYLPGDDRFPNDNRLPPPYPPASRPGGGGDRYLPASDRYPGDDRLPLPPIRRPGGGNRYSPDYNRRPGGGGDRYLPDYNSRPGGNDRYPPIDDNRLPYPPPPPPSPNRYIPRDRPPIDGYLPYPPSRYDDRPGGSRYDEPYSPPSRNRYGGGDRDRDDALDRGRPSYDDRYLPGRNNWRYPDRSRPSSSSRAGGYQDRYDDRDRYNVDRDRDRYGSNRGGGDRDRNRFGDRYGGGRYSGNKNGVSYYGDDRDGGNRWFFRPDRRPNGRPYDERPARPDERPPPPPPFSGAHHRPYSPGPDGPIYDGVNNRPFSTRCDDGDSFKQVGTRQRIRKDYVRRFTVATTLDQCERECLDSRDFICRSFNFRDGPPPFETERENCELSDRDSRDFEGANPQFFDTTTGNFDYYERSNSRQGGDADCLDVTQVCNEDGMEFTLRTPEGFYGRIYTYGYYDRCFFRGNGGTLNVLRISGAQGYPECGTQRYGDTMTNIVIVQFSDFVQTGKDKRFNLTCLFRGPGETVVKSEYIGAGSGSPIPIEYLPAENSWSNKVRLMILYQGRPTTTIAVGDPLTFRLEAQDGYNYVQDIFATNVVARDPYTGRSVQLIDRYGCPVDSYVFPELDRGRSGDTLEARFNAFKIPESNFLVFEATVRSCREGCQPAYCQSSQSGRSEPSFGRRKRETINGTYNIAYGGNDSNNNNVTSVEDDMQKRVSENDNTTISSVQQNKAENDEDSESVTKEAEAPEFVREMIEVFESREELQQEARRAVPLTETVCITNGEYHGLISAILVLAAILITISLLAGLAYRRYWSVMHKNILADRSSSSRLSSYPPTTTTRSGSGLSIFGGGGGGGFQKPFNGFVRSRNFPGLSKDSDLECSLPAPGGPFEDPSEPIYTDPSLFERSRSLRSIAVSQKRRHSPGPQQQ
ncbi:PREDICTED: uncharacterized protein LOC108556286 isoform X2 [Nicrophorus vespilloides]|uniref:Uncharacterized protein LOC108556286 isoform X2 n=1 Tax=Nicrophorus vespilloides TaxID=110193 RepID=A0ABM1LZQ2_NICVS|nr:PREDICTED: uncharacterized protein LOC108556286 isoform X2 [Nicrophorus vespilloides]